MSTNDRRRRPSLDRTHPIRSWATLLDGAVSRGSEHPDSDEAPADATGRVTNAVSKSVEIGYRVIDDYLQQGQRVARRLSDGSTAPEVLATEIQDLGVRMARYASDFMAAWMELLELTARGGASVPRPTPPAPDEPPTSSARPPASDPAGAVQRSDGVPVRVAVTSLRPVEVQVDYRSDRVTGAVRVHDLRTLAPDAPRIEGVSFRPATPSNPPTLVLSVPHDQRPGIYEGLLVDESTNRPVGSVRVDVLAAGDETAP